MIDCGWIDIKNLTAYEKELIIAKHYGLAHQLHKLSEECIELADAINHKNTDNIKEEMIDVQIMLDQVFELFGWDRIVDDMNKKLDRQLKRMEAEK